jgi:hypothetical protein
MARITHKEPIHLGLDVHRDTISVATLPPDRATAAVEQIPSDAAAVLAFIGPRAAGDKVKTHRRDCWRLARLHRAGELVAIRIPEPRAEAIWDLCRARADLDG